MAEEPLEELTVLNPVVPDEKEEQILLRKIPMGAGSKLDSDTVRGKIPLFTVSTGSVTQVVRNVVTASTASAGTIPLDDTIPQNTEGTEFFTLSITPTSTSNLLKIEVIFLGTISGATHNLTVALFQDSTVNALAASAERNTNNSNRIVSFTFFMTAGTISATIFKVRAGSEGAGTTRINGSASGGTRYFGGVAASSITITEYTV